MTQIHKGGELDRLKTLLENAQPLKYTPSHLEPEDSAFSLTSLNSQLRAHKLIIIGSLVAGIEEQVESVAGWEREERAGLVCLPAFESEWALSVVGDRVSRFWVVVTEVQQNIWYSRVATGEHSSLPPFKTHCMEVPAALGAAVCDIWKQVLSETRYPQKPLLGCCDGVTYHFTYSRKSKHPEIAGKTWSPEEDTVPGKLVGLSHAVKNFAQDVSNRDVFQNVIEDHLEWFRTNFPQTSP